MIDGAGRSGPHAGVVTRRAHSKIGRRLDSFPRRPLCSWFVRSLKVLAQPTTEQTPDFCHQGADMGVLTVAQPAPAMGEP